MRTLPQVLSSEFIKDTYVRAYLIEFSFSSPGRYTDLDVDVWYGGNQFLSRGIEFTLADMSYLPSADTISFTIDNVGLEMAGVLMTEEVRGKGCTIRIAAVDRHAQVIDTMIVFKGMIDGVSDISYARATFDIANEFILWNRKVPRRIHSSTCAWVFKDATTCRYGGVETWCDKSYDRCVVLVNTPNFGGFPFLPSLEGAEIQWGPRD